MVDFHSTFYRMVCSPIVAYIHIPGRANDHVFGVYVTLIDPVYVYSYCLWIRRYFKQISFLILLIGKAPVDFLDFFPFFKRLCSTRLNLSSGSESEIGEYILCAM